MNARPLRFEDSDDSWREPALAAALDAIGAAALVVDARGRVKAANPLAREWLAKNPARAAGEVVRSLRSTPGAGAFCARALPGGSSPHFLLVRRESVDEDRVASRVARVVTRYELTPSQARVLQSLVTGTSNRAIAARLGISERTVEVHVTNMLAKLDADNRSSLVALVLA